MNPVKVNNSSDLYEAQPVTFETLRIAREFTRSVAEVKLYSAQYPEDLSMVPEYVQSTPNLERSILDIAPFNKNRKLPLIKDILDRLYESSNADYFIYTNVDIALQPYFYLTIMGIIKKGYDAFTVNRRTISKTFKQKQLTEMFAAVGEAHPGHDCFVFNRDLYSKFNFGTVCIGADWIGRTMLANLICHSRKFKTFENKHLTFHLGDDRTWKVPIYNDYSEHNKKELHKILLTYESAGLMNGHPIPEEYLRKTESSKLRKKTFFFSLKKFFSKHST